MGTPKTVSATEREYARIGAALELAAKQAEIDALIAIFPALRTAAHALRPVRKRRAWTAARRKRHAERMRAAYRRRARAGVMAAR